MLGADGKPLRVAKGQKRYAYDTEGNVIESETIDDPNVGLDILEDVDARRQRKFSEKFTETVKSPTQFSDLGLDVTKPDSKLFLDKGGNVVGFTGSREQAQENAKTNPRLADFLKKDDEEKQSARADALARIYGDPTGSLDPTRKLPEVIGKGKDPIVEAARGLGDKPTAEAIKSASDIAREALKPTPTATLTAGERERRDLAGRGAEKLAEEEKKGKSSDDPRDITITKGKQRRVVIPSREFPSRPESSFHEVTSSLLSPDVGSAIAAKPDPQKAAHREKTTLRKKMPRRVTLPPAATKAEILKKAQEEKKKKSKQGQQSRGVTRPRSFNPAGNPLAV